MPTSFPTYYNMRHSFHGSHAAESLEEFREMTYSYDEVFGHLSPVSQGMRVTEIATFVYGRCFVFEMRVPRKGNSGFRGR